MKVFGTSGFKNSLNVSEGIFSLPYFHPNISSSDASLLLSPLADGAYILRVSSQPGSFAYSFKNKGKVVSTLVKYYDNQFYIQEGQVSRNFESMEALIELYREKGILTTAVSWVPYSEDSFFSIL